MEERLAEVREKLAAPFPEDMVSFLPRAINNGRALALPHIDARAVMSRLDDACGPDAWEFHWELMAQDAKIVRIKAALTVFGVTKCDAGEANGEEEPLKSAVSDGLKRAAVHFGIGRYLYEIPAIWAEYDPHKRRFVETPRLPASARPNVQSRGPRNADEVRERVRNTLDGMAQQSPPLISGGGNGNANDAIRRSSLRLQTVCREVGIDHQNVEWLRSIIAVALDRDATVKELDAVDRGTLAEFIDAHPESCRDLKPDEEEQSETLPLGDDADAAAGIPAGLAK